MRRGLLVLVPFVGCLFPSVGELTGGDASATDAVSADAGLDGFFCTGDAHTFCVDFDQHPIAWGWDSLQADTMTTVALDNTFATTSPPNSLLSRVDNPTSKVYARVAKDFIGTKTEFVTSFDVNIASITSNDLSFSVISVSDANKVGCNFILTAKTGITSVQIQQHDGSGKDLGDTTVPLDNPLVAGTWSRLEFHIKGSTTVTGLTVLVDGVPSSSDPRFSSGPLTGCLMSNDVFLGLGLFYSIGTGLEEHFDNVIVDVK